MLKHFTTLAIALLLSATAASATSLSVQHKDGSKLDVRISDDLVISMTNSTFSVVSAKANVSYELSDVAFFKYIIGDSSVESNAADSTEVAIFPDHISFIGQQPADVRLYGIDGRQHNVEKTASGEISTEAYPSGCYILVFDNHSVKFTVK